MKQNEKTVGSWKRRIKEFIINESNGEEELTSEKVTEYVKKNLLSNWKKEEPLILTIIKDTKNREMKK
jgi:hypothetical protein